MNIWPAQYIDPSCHWSKTLSFLSRRITLWSPELEMIALMPGWKEHAWKRKKLVAVEPITKHVPRVRNIYWSCFSLMEPTRLREEELAPLFPDSLLERKACQISDQLRSDGLAPGMHSECRAAYKNQQKPPGLWKVTRHPRNTFGFLEREHCCQPGACSGMSAS